MWSPLPVGERVRVRGTIPESEAPLHPAVVLRTSSQPLPNGER
jgi:hypothetical protein